MREKEGKRAGRPGTRAAGLAGGHLQMYVLSRRLLNSEL